ncbi:MULTISPECIES: hypothetical protein [Micrococcaceae]|uniref:hypothetical protein n=1 Tax=Micrococcaceae TaxID=1268 RepID=UPI000BB701CD|nr:hypothetical protein [Glutamicibacter sp. BW78]PCC24902.1 hypothetical protein CIK75_12185 [Glutamicibacter sp. BW78]
MVDVENSRAFIRALEELQTTEAVTMAGKPAGWSTARRWLFLVLIGLVSLVGLGMAIALGVVLPAESLRVTGMTIFGIISVYAMLFGGLALLITTYRRQLEFADLEREGVRLEARGMTLRGIGPIPWQDFVPARSMMVRAEHSGNYTLRAVMPLTQPGFVNVNQRMPRQLRGRISPAVGPFWNRRHRWIYVPGVEGMSEGAVMELINTAHWMFGQAVHAQP